MSGAEKVREGKSICSVFKIPAFQVWAVNNQVSTLWGGDSSLVKQKPERKANLAHLFRVHNIGPSSVLSYFRYAKHFMVQLCEACVPVLVIYLGSFFECHITKSVFFLSIYINTYLIRT